MGEHIVAEGSKPLTSLAIPTPGPSDYSPNMALTIPCVPQHSIVGKPKYAKGKKWLIFQYNFRKDVSPGTLISNIEKVEKDRFVPRVWLLYWLY